MEVIRDINLGEAMDITFSPLFFFFFFYMYNDDGMAGKMKEELKRREETESTCSANM